MKIKITLQPKQRLALRKSFDTPVLFYGGSKGGGKSHLVRAREIIRRLKHAKTKGLIVRKTYPELLSNHIRPFFRDYPIVRTWFNKAEKAIYWPNGSITEFSYLKNTDDVYTYQGREYEDISIDEITQHEEEVYKILRSSNRTANKDFSKNAIPTMILTGNPGGVGHAWCKRLFIDNQYKETEEANDYEFVQASVYDNKALLEADPGYIKRLKSLPEDKRRAYLEGDWDIFSGQVFSEFRRSLHTMKPVIPRGEVDYYLSIDWGYSEKSAFAAYLHAVKKETDSTTGNKFNRVITFKEWYANLKTPEEWADIIYKDCQEIGVKPLKGYTDPAMHNTQTDGSVSIAQLMEKRWRQLNNKHWIRLKKGNNNRIARVATLHNWLKISSDGLPYWIITENCNDLIREIPSLVYDENKVEDVDTNMSDHGYDSVGYLLTMIKFISVEPGNIPSVKENKRVPRRSDGSVIINPSKVFQDLRDA